MLNKTPKEMIEQELLDEIGVLQRNQVSVLDFGCRADGITDDTTALQNALNQTGVIRFPKGHYIFTELLVPSNTIIEAKGATLQGKLTITSKSNVVINNAFFKSTTGYCVEVSSSENVLIHNFRSDECNSGINVQSSSKKVRILNAIFKNTKNVAIRHNSTLDCVIENVNVFNAVWGLNIQTNTENLIIRNYVAVLGDATTTPTGLDSYFVQTPEHGLYAHNFKGIILEGFYMKGWNRLSSGCGLKIRNGERFSAVNGEVHDCNQHVGLYIQGESTYNFLRDVKLKNVYFKNSSGSSITVYIRDYVMLDITRVLLEDCTFESRTTFNTTDLITKSIVVLKDCTYKLGANFTGVADGNLIVEGGKVISSTGNAFNFAGNWKMYKKIKGVHFLEWNTSLSVGSTYDDYVNRAGIGIKNDQKFDILECVFYMNTENGIALFGSVAEGIQQTRVMRNHGSKGFYSYISTPAKLQIGFNSSYGGLGGNSWVSMLNNQMINADGTVTSF